MRSQDIFSRVTFYEESILHVTRGMVRREVECSKVVIIVFYLWTVGDPETDPDENLLYLFESLS